MSDPLRPKDKPAPRRAEPIQPDPPGRGNTARAPRQPSQTKESFERAVEQARTALDNVRGG